MESGKMNRREFLSHAGASVAALLIDSKINLTQSSESGEVIPSSESIVATFDKILEGQHATERRKGADSLGAYLWEMEFPIENGTAELNYMRKGQHEIGGSASMTKIHVVFFDEDGVPEGGSDVAEFKDGIWIMT